MNHIIALGGGGFAMESDNNLLDDYILKQADSNKPKICFIPTVSGESPDYIKRFYDSFSKMKCNVIYRYLNLTLKTEERIF